MTLFKRMSINLPITLAVLTLCLSLTTLAASQSFAKSQTPVLLVTQQREGGRTLENILPMFPNQEEKVTTILSSTNDILVMICSSREIVIFQKEKLLWHNISSEQDHLLEDKFDAAIKALTKNNETERRFKGTKLNSIVVPTKNHVLVSRLTVSPSQASSYTLDGKAFDIEYNKRKHSWAITWDNKVRKQP